MVKEVNKEKALNTARGLIEEAVAVATEAGIDPSSVIEPHCRETPARQHHVIKVEDSDETLAELCEAAKRIIKARGARLTEGARLEHKDGELTIARSEIDEIEITFHGHLVFRARSSGARSSDHLFDSGDWIKEVERIDQSLR